MVGRRVTRPVHLDHLALVLPTHIEATASIGGFIATTDALCTMMTWSARPYTFQAAISPADAAAVLAALDQIEENPEHARRLHDNNAYLRARLREYGFDLRSSESPIVPIYIPNPDALQRIVTEMYEQGVFSTAITYPIVPPNDGRIRMILNAAHTHEQIDRSVAVITGICKKYGVLT